MNYSAWVNINQFVVIYVYTMVEIGSASLTQMTDPDLTRMDVTWFH